MKIAPFIHQLLIAKSSFQCSEIQYQFLNYSYTNRDRHPGVNAVKCDQCDKTMSSNNSMKKVSTRVSFPNHLKVTQQTVNSSIFFAIGRPFVCTVRVPMR